MNDENYQILTMHICKFKNIGKNLFLNSNSCPERLCILDKKEKIVIDVKSGCQYPYVKIINMTYIISNGVAIDDSMEYACLEYSNIYEQKMSKDDLLLCKEIIQLLKQGVTFPDGNKEKDILERNEMLYREYGELLNTDKNSNKILQKRKKRK